MALPSRLFCDTSFFYACLDRGDINHDRATALIDEAAASASVFYTTWDIVSETITLLRYRKGFTAALAFIEQIKPHLTIVEYGARVRDEAEGIFRKHGRSRRLSFCDAISFVVVTTLLNHIPCLAFDSDFRRLGLTVIN